MSYDLPLHLTLTGRPLLLYPAIAPELHQRLQASYQPRAARLFNRAKRRKAKKDKPQSQTPAASHRYALAQANIAAPREPYIEHITVSGPLLNKAEYFEGILCVDGYDRIEAAFNRAISDNDCAGILFEIDSPGGMTSGCFELSEKIREWAALKPIVIHCSGLLCSAAYSLAAGATHIIAQRTALIGSIGVVYGRLDVTGWNEKNGIKIDFIKSGDQKTWGNPETPMADAELAAHQTEIMQLADMFFEIVAAGRNLDIQAIQDLQAGAFLTNTAITHGLVDEMGDLAFALRHVTELASSAPPSAGPGPEQNTPTPTSQSAAPAVQSTAKETAMSKFNRGALRATLSLTAAAMASNAMEDDEIDAMEDDELTEAVAEETEDEVEAMDDDEVTAMDDEINAMDDAEKEAMEDDDVEAMDEDEIEAMDEDDTAEKEAKFKVTASRIAHRAVAKCRKSLAARSRKSGAARVKAAKSSPQKDNIQAAVTAERNRVAAIQALPEAAAQPALAAHFIAEGTPFKSAKAGLKAAAKSQPNRGSRLSSVHNPDIGIGSNQSRKPSPGEDLIAAAKAMANPVK